MYRLVLKCKIFSLLTQFDKICVFVNLNVSHFWLKYQSKSEPHFFLSFTMNGKGGYQKGDKTNEQIRYH